MNKLLLIGLMLFSVMANAFPTLIMSSSTRNLQVGQSTTVTFTFSEPVTGFISSDIHVNGNGTIGSFTTVNSSTYTALFTKTVEKTSTSIIVDNKSYSSIADGSLGMYSAYGFNPSPLIYVERSIFTGLKDLAVPQPICPLVGEILLNSSAVQVSPPQENYYVRINNSYEKIPQGCLVRLVGGLYFAKKIAPKPFELANPQGGHNHSTLMPKARYAQIKNIEGHDRPRVKPRNQQCSAGVGGFYHCGSSQGEFRISIGPVKIDADDPIVYPGQKGAAHLHIFFANVALNYQTNNASLLYGSKTTASGGGANKTAYWMPAMIDTATGVAQFPFGGIFYYKSGTDMNFIEPIPQGLKGISGNPSAVDSASQTDYVQFTCFPEGRSGASQKSSDTMPDCSGKQYAYIRAAVDFQHCLADDGFGNIKLDSPDHRSHWIPPAHPGTRLANDCTADFPHRITNIGQNADYLIAPDQNTKTWRLSSDNYSSASPGGASLHADYWGMWQNYWMSRITTQCNNTPMNCENNYVGLSDGITIASITAVGTTATVTTTSPHYLNNAYTAAYPGELRGRISGVSGADAAAYNFDATKVTATDSVNQPTALYPIGNQNITVLNATQFTYTLNSTPGDTSKVGGELTGAKFQWGELFCDDQESDPDCPSDYNEFYYGSKT